MMPANNSFILQERGLKDKRAEETSEERGNERKRLVCLVEAGMRNETFSSRIF